MSDAFTIDELLFASQLMFPADFERLYAKYSGEDAGMVQHVSYQFKKEFKSNLILYINSLSRSHTNDLVILTKMINELIKKN